MEKFIKIKIHFGSKGYIKNVKETNMYTSGYAYFIFDLEQNKYVHEYLELIESNFRMTDKNHLISQDKFLKTGKEEPTDYYLNPNVKYFRDNFLDKYSHNKDHLSIRKTTYQMLNKEQIKEINDYFKNQKFSTIRNQYSYLSGSNFSGAETFHKASEILCLENEIIGCNFANTMKSFRCSKNKMTSAYPDDLKSYSLNEVLLLDLIPNLKQKFYKYNEYEIFKDNEYGFTHLDETLDDLNKAIKLKSKRWTVSPNQEMFIDSIINRTIPNYETYMNTDKLHRRLRSFYTANIQKYINENILPIHSTIVKYNIAGLQNAHIIKFSDSCKKLTKHDLLICIDPFNSLRLDATTHALFDDHEIYFDENGWLIRKNGVKEGPFIDMENMPTNTRFYYEQYLLKSKRN